MDSEPEFRATPAEIARITRTALSALAEDHLIIPKDELKPLLDSHSTDVMTEMWATILRTYEGTASQLVGKVTPQYLQGFEMGGKLLARMHDVYLESYAETFGANHDENSKNNI